MIEDMARVATLFLLAAIAALAAAAAQFVEGGGAYAFYGVAALTAGAAITGAVRIWRGAPALGRVRRQPAQD